VVFKPLSAFLNHAMARTDDAHPLATTASQHVRYRELLKAVLPEPLFADVTSVATRNQSLTITVRSHASATKLYQFQQRVIAHFAAKDLNFKEIRVFVQSISDAPTLTSRRPELPPEAAAPLERAASQTQNPALKAALTRLSSHAKTQVKH
jgi:hypothetical protein